MSDLARVCSMDSGQVIALKPYFLPDRLVAFGTDCRIFVAKKKVTYSEYEALGEERTKERDYVCSLIDADLPMHLARTLDLKRLRTFSGPPEWRESCPACDREEAPRLDPCLFGERAVNRNYLAMAASFMRNGDADVYIPKDVKAPILLDSDEYRIALMPLADSVMTEEYTADLPHFLINGRSKPRPAT